MKRFAALLVVAASLALVAGCAGKGTQGTGESSVAAARGCAAGYVAARMSWGRRCLVHGQYCKQRRDKAYHRLGFHCHRGARLD